MERPVDARLPDTGSAANSTTRRSGLYRQAQKRPYLFFIAPALIVLLAVAIYPIIFSTGLSFFKVTFDSLDRPFVGLDNFATNLADKDFRTVMGNTLLYVLVTVTGSVALGFGTALLLRRITVGKNWLRIILIIPMMAAPVVVGLTWNWMLDPLLGLINFVITGLGFPRQTLLAQANTARLTVMLVDIWQWYPLVFLIIDAGLSSLPRAPYEAAKLEGASAWMVFRRITIPMLRPVLLVALLLRTVDAFRTFDLVRVMTDGGPGNLSTETVSLFLYRTAFTFNKLSKAGAGATIMLIVIGLISALIFRFLYREVESR
jgi:multiple sugar transport system permease protein